MELQLVDKKQSPHIPRLQKKKVKVVIEQFWQVVHLQLAAYKNQLPLCSVWISEELDPSVRDRLRRALLK